MILTEGDSANGFALAGRAALTEVERKYIGFYTLGGKILNVKKAKKDKIRDSERFQDIIKVLGLKINAKKYDEMRYGKVIVMTD